MAETAIVKRQLPLPRTFEYLFYPKRYKVAHGGRGSAKSWSYARALIIQMCKNRIRVLCTREFQNSIAESVHRLIADQIFEMGFASLFVVTDKGIKCRNGGEFIFAGLRTNVTKIKSMEGIDIVWVEEAEVISERSWEILIPTVRKPGSEIWITFNPDQPDDPTYLRFVKNQPPDCIVVQVNWQQNPYFPIELAREKDYLYSIDPDAAAHVWGGQCRVNAAAQIFRNRYKVHSFDISAAGVEPFEVRYYHGVDFGFSVDPFAIVRCWKTGTAGVDEELWIDAERFEHHKEIDYLPTLLREIPTTTSWPIKADASRPETISYIRRQGFNITGAEKWGGSVEDGLAHLKAFRMIHIHDSCIHLRDEFRLYSYKVDQKTGDVLPIIVDKHNHGIDALRYALDGLIHKRGADKVWERL